MSVSVTTIPCKQYIYHLAFLVTNLFELGLGVDVHVADLTVESFVLESSRRLGRRDQLGFDPCPREGLDGSIATSSLEHRLVLSALADIKSNHQIIKRSISRLTLTTGLSAVSHHCCGPAAARQS